MVERQYGMRRIEYWVCRETRCRVEGVEVDRPSLKKSVGACLREEIKEILANRRLELR